MKTATEDRFAELLRHAASGPRLLVRSQLSVGGAVTILTRTILSGQKATNRLDELSAFVALTG